MSGVLAEREGWEEIGTKDACVGEEKITRKRSGKKRKEKEAEKKGDGRPPTAGGKRRRRGKTRRRGEKRIRGKRTIRGREGAGSGAQGPRRRDAHSVYFPIPILVYFPIPKLVCFPVLILVRRVSSSPY